MTIQGKELALCLLNDPDYDCDRILANNNKDIPTLGAKSWLAMVVTYYRHYQRRFPGVRFTSADLLAAALQLSIHHEE